MCRLHRLKSGEKLFVLNKKVSCPKRVLTQDLDEIHAIIELSPRKSSRHLAQKVEISQTVVQKVFLEFINRCLKFVNQGG